MRLTGEDRTDPASCARAPRGGLPEERTPVRLPLRLRLFGLVYGRWSTPISRTPAEAVPALRERQRRTYGLRAARIVMGRHAEGVEVENTTAATADGHALPIRIYRPPTAAGRPLPAVLNFHGGGVAPRRAALGRGVGPGGGS